MVDLDELDGPADDEDLTGIVAPAKARRFENGVRFWEIWFDHHGYLLRFGRLGDDDDATEERTHVTSDPQTALREYARLVRLKRACGYREVERALPPAAPPSLDATQLARHLDNLDDDASYLVLADWLQAQGHPWGELIMLHHAMRSDPSLADEATRLLTEHGTAILGPLADAPYAHWDWHLGLLERAVVTCKPEAHAIVDAAAALLALPVAHRLEALVLGPIPTTFYTWRNWETSLDAIDDPWEPLEPLARAIPPHIRSIGFGAWPGPGAAAYVRMPRFDDITDHFPHLRNLELTGTLPARAGRLALTDLVSLELRFARADEDALAMLHDAVLPKLERLSLWLGGGSQVVLDDVHPALEDYEDGDSRYPPTFSADDLDCMDVHGVEGAVTPRALATFLATVKLPALAHLGIPSSCLSPAHLTAIATSPLVARIKTLDLSGGTIDEAGADALIAAKASLAHLAWIDVTRNCLGAVSGRALAAALPNARVGEPNVKTDPVTDFHFRYVATME